MSLCKAFKNSIFLDYSRNEVDVCCVSEWDGNERKKFLPQDFDNFVKHNQSEYNLSKISWRPGCQQCFNQEKHSDGSARTQSNKLLDDTNNRIQEITIHTGPICNLRCVQCNSSNSTKWSSFLSYNPDIKKLLIKQKIFEQHDSSIMDNILFNRVLNTDIKKITLTGGEPLYNSLTDRLILYILENGLHKQLSSFSVVTNGTTYFNDVFKEFLKKFNGHLDVSFSADGTGEVFDYIRRGHTWDKFKDVVINTNYTLKKYQKQGTNNIHTGYCLQVLNSKTYYNDMDFFDSWKFIDSFSTTVVQGPSYFTLMALKEKYAEKWNMTSYGFSYDKREHQQLIEILDRIDDIDNHKSFRNFIPELGEI